MNKRARKNAKSDKAPASNLKEALTLGGALFEREVHVELCGNREALIDGCQGIVEYNEEAIRLNITKGQLKIWGRGLQIACLAEEGLIVRLPDSRDNRQTIITPTQFGIQFVQEHRTGLVDAMAKALELLGPEDAQNYLRIQKKILQNLTPPV